MSSQISFAVDISTGRVKHISEVVKGLKCECQCADCGEKLEAIKGDIRDHHFRHAGNKTCNGETAMHLFAKQVIADNNSIYIPGQRLFYNNIRVEKRLDTKKPDVTVLVDGKDVYFEIRVSHAVKEDKRQFYCNGKHKCIEIDLSDKDLWLLPPEELKQFILEETYNKDIVFWEEEKEAAISEEKSPFDFWPIVAFIGAILLIILAAVFFKKKRKRVFGYY